MSNLVVIQFEARVVSPKTAWVVWFSFCQLPSTGETLHQTLQELAADGLGDMLQELDTSPEVAGARRGRQSLS